MPAEVRFDYLDTTHVGAGGSSYAWLGVVLAVRAVIGHAASPTRPLNTAPWLAFGLWPPWPPWPPLGQDLKKILLLGSTLVGYHPSTLRFIFFFEVSIRGGHGGHGGPEDIRSLSSSCKSLTERGRQPGRMPRPHRHASTPSHTAPPRGACAEAPHATIRSLAVPLTRSPPPACARRCARSHDSRQAAPTGRDTRPLRGPRCRCGEALKRLGPRTAQLRARTRQRPPAT